MIFGRKKKAAQEAESTERPEVTDAEDGEPTEEIGDTAGATDAEAPEAAAEETEATRSEPDEELDEWAAYDLSQDWREDGPFDFDEVDLSADEVERIDFGSLIITPIPDSEIRLQVAEGTQQIVSALLVRGESALEISAFAAPRSPGMWAEVRDQIVAQTAEQGGSAECVRGPFGTELVRNVPMQTPNGLAFQPSRTWVAEGPRWFLRGVLFGRAALSDAVDDDVVGPFLDAFSDVIVRRDDAPKPVGDVLTLTIPEDLQAQEPPTAQG